jgi:hypothetical protein
MPSPISRTRCASRPPKAGRRPRRCAALEGAQAAGSGDSGQVIVEGAPLSTGPRGAGDGGRSIASSRGWRSDPFFFDRRGALNKLQFTGEDFFADQDVCSIVLEVPNSALGSKEVGLWHRTLVPAHCAGGGWVSAERGAAPATLPRPRSYQCGEGCLSRRGSGGRCPFRCRFRPRAGAHGWVYEGGAWRVAGTMLPEILRYEPTRPASFPDNGRTLIDDAVDALLPILTKSREMPSMVHSSSKEVAQAIGLVSPGRFPMMHLLYLVRKPSDVSDLY